MTDISGIVRLLVLLLLIAISVILITRKLAVPYTLGLVVVGFLISFFGHVTEFHLTPELVLFVFLPALLFEGSWSMSLRHLRANWPTILMLVGPGMLLELVLIAVPLHFFTGISWLDAFLLAAILCPTDPIAVLGLLRQMKVNEDLSTVIEAESLFNDGVAGAFYQTFLVLVLASVSGHPLEGWQAWLEGLRIFLLQAGGGMLVGLICGGLASYFVKFVDDPLIETTVTVITAYGVYLLADFLHTSGIMAVIFAALLLGYYGQRKNMSQRTREAVDNFWSMIAFLANALVFLLVGGQLNPSELLASQEYVPLLVIAVSAIISVLLARFIMIVLLPKSLPPMPGLRVRSWRFILFWSGLRGALSLALVLALPLNVPARNLLIFSTYAVVFFTLLVQGFSLRFIFRRLPQVPLPSSPS